MTALRLFAKDGYEAVSVSTIAGELGITKGALYKHYNDPDIYFCSINKPIMTSEKHTYKQLYNFAKKTHMVNIPLLNCKTRLGIVAIALILATINLFIGNTILRVIIYTSNTIPV